MNARKKKVPSPIPWRWEILPSDEDLKIAPYRQRVWIIDANGATICNWQRSPEAEIVAKRIVDAVNG